MLSLQIRISSNVHDTLKRNLGDALPGVKSSHRVEALARGLGFQTNAALLAELRQRQHFDTKIDGGRFVGYLQDHNFSAQEAHVFRAAGRVAITAVLEKSPNLSMWGIGFGPPRRKIGGGHESPHEQYARFERDRAMFDSEGGVNQFLRAIVFLTNVPATRTIRPGTNSYRLKHVAENYPSSFPDGETLGPDYVSNGALIAAALHLGFKVKRYEDDHGYDVVQVSFNMSKSVCDDLDCRYRPDGARAQNRHRKEQRRQRIEELKARYG